MEEAAPEVVVAAAGLLWAQAGGGGGGGRWRRLLRRRWWRRLGCCGLMRVVAAGVLRRMVAVDLAVVMMAGRVAVRREVRREGWSIRNQERLRMVRRMAGKWCRSRGKGGLVVASSVAVAVVWLGVAGGRRAAVAWRWR